jgi:hypothetical protein
VDARFRLDADPPARFQMKKHPGGRPPKFTELQEFQAKIDAYFAACDQTHDPYTVTGLALALDTTRETLLDYEKNNPNRAKFSDTIKRAKLRVQNYAEKRLYSNSPTGPIFALKNFGWRDKQEVDHTTGGQPFVLPAEIIAKNNLSGKPLEQRP